MTRPRKQTVDYFPHCCTHKSTMFILEQRYGNDGYAFWFKLLELLGSTAGHFLDMNDEMTWEFLQAKTRLSLVACEDILNLLCRVKAIDADLWSKRVIWSQNFIDNVSDAYKNRKTQVPLKPNHFTYLQVENGLLPVETKLSPVDYESKPEETDINTDNYDLATRRKPQSKVKYSKIETPLPPFGECVGEKLSQDQNPEPEPDVNNCDGGDDKTPAVGKELKPTRGMTKQLASLFETFWGVYPKKRARGQAEITWVKLAPGEQLTALMVSAVEYAKTTEEWKKNGGQYIPYPASWLNAKCWMDEQRPALSLPSENTQQRNNRLIDASTSFDTLYADSGQGGNIDIRKGLTR